MPGETIVGGEFFVAAGGKGANPAVAAARLGAEVRFIARVGADAFGDQAIVGYEKDGRHTDLIARDPNNATGVALILVDESGEKAISVASGENHPMSVVLLGMGPTCAIVTMGAEGALLADESGVVMVPATPIEAVDTTAAGDAFTGALAFGWGVGLPLSEAVILASTAGAFAATRMGAQPSLASRAELEEFCLKTGIEWQLGKPAHQ